MPDERKQRSEAERLLHGLSRLEVPAALEQRALSRLRKALKEDAHRTRHSALRDLIPAMTPIGLLILVVIGLFGREESRMLQPKARSIAGRTPSASGSSLTASDISVAIKAPERPSESRRLASLKRGGMKFAPAQDGFPEQNSDGLRGSNSGPAPENASGQIMNAEAIGTAIQGIGNIAVPGNPLPRMRAATIPGEPLPRFEVAAAPGTPLPSFAEATTNGDHQ